MNVLRYMRTVQGNAPGRGIMHVELTRFEMIDMLGLLSQDIAEHIKTAPGMTIVVSSAGEDVQATDPAHEPEPTPEEDTAV